MLSKVLVASALVAAPVLAADDGVCTCTGECFIYADPHVISFTGDAWTFTNPGDHDLYNIAEDFSVTAYVSPENNRGYMTAITVTDSRANLTNTVDVSKDCDRATQTFNFPFDDINQSEELVSQSGYVNVTCKYGPKGCEATDSCQWYLDMFLQKVNQFPVNDTSIPQDSSGFIYVEDQIIKSTGQCISENTSLLRSDPIPNKPVCVCPFTTQPTTAPSESPSAAPSASPTATTAPSMAPSKSPSAAPSASPSTSPSAAPSASPTATTAPSMAPSKSPSAAPSASPTTTLAPSMAPSVAPQETCVCEAKCNNYADPHLITFSGFNTTVGTPGEDLTLYEVDGLQLVASIEGDDNRKYITSVNIFGEETITSEDCYKQGEYRVTKSINEPQDAVLSQTMDVDVTCHYGPKDCDKLNDVNCTVYLDVMLVKTDVLEVNAGSAINFFEVEDMLNSTGDCLLNANFSGQNPSWEPFCNCSSTPAPSMAPTPTQPFQQNLTCTMEGDPHVTSFDGNYFDAIPGIPNNVTTLYSMGQELGLVTELSNYQKPSGEWVSYVEVAYIFKSGKWAGVVESPSCEPYQPTVRADGEADPHWSAQYTVIGPNGPEYVIFYFVCKEDGMSITVNKLNNQEDPLDYERQNYDGMCITDNIELYDGRYGSLPALDSVENIADTRSDTKPLGSGVSSVTSGAVLALTALFARFN